MIYLDNNATTRPSPGVVLAMRRYLEDCYFNASAVTAALTGADRPRRDAASAMARLLKAEEPDCFAFTSGATESNNWVFSSVIHSGKKGSVLISAVEHDSVSESAAALARFGFDVVEVTVDSNGLVDLGALRNALTNEALLVSIIAANNETGVLEPIQTIGAMIREHAPNALFHSDATQAVGKIPIDLQVDWADVDLLSFSGHKFHGPKGIGGLYIRPGIEILPLLLGGKQEQGRRSGTENTPGLAGLALAARESEERLRSACMDVQHIRDRFERQLLDAFPDAVIHSSGAPRLPTTSCCSVGNLPASELASELMKDDIIVGIGSACSSGALRPAKTLSAMGVPHDVASRALRVSLSDASTDQDLTALIVAIKHIVAGRPRPAIVGASVRDEAYGDPFLGKRR